jgi:hypothetical protein
MKTITKLTITSHLFNQSIGILGNCIKKIPPTLIYNLNDRTVLIREGKPLYPFLSKLDARRSVRFGIVKVYVEKECRKVKFMYNIQGVPKKRDKSIASLFIGGF